MHDIASYNWCIIRTEPIITLSPFPHSHSSSRVREELIAGIPAKRATLCSCRTKKPFCCLAKETADYFIFRAYSSALGPTRKIGVPFYPSHLITSGVIPWIPGYALWQTSVCVSVSVAVHAAVLSLSPIGKILHPSKSSYYGELLALPITFG